MPGSESLTLTAHSFFALALGALAGYLLGGLNGSLLLSKFILKDDIRRHGSGNAGATNVLRTYGKGWTVLVSLWDMGKGAAVLALVKLMTRLLQDSPADFSLFFLYGPYAAGYAVILGHVFPLIFGFKGGKGVITACMVMLLLDWRAACIALAFFFTVVLLTRYISLGAIVAVLVLPIAGWLVQSPPEWFVIALPVTLLIIILHRANIKRLIQGTENKFGTKKKEVNKNGTST